MNTVLVKRRKAVSDVRSGVWDLIEDGVTQSFVSKFLTCPESARWRYVKGYREKAPSQALQFGDVFHQAKEAGHTLMKDSRFNLSPEEAAQEAGCAVQRLEESRVLYPHEDLEETFGMVEAMIPGYFAVWGKDDLSREWVALEEEIEVPITVLGVTFMLRAKLDGLFRSGKHGRITLTETKTKGRIDEGAIMSKLNIDFQTLFYLALVRIKYGEFARRVMYDVVRRPQLRRGKGGKTRHKVPKTVPPERLVEYINRVKADVLSRPDWYYMRFTMIITEPELDAWIERDLMPILEQIVRWYRKEFNYHNSYACSNGSSVCPFLRLCTSGDKTGLVKVASAHSELGTKS